MPIGIPTGVRSTIATDLLALTSRIMIPAAPASAVTDDWSAKFFSPLENKIVLASIGQDNRFYAMERATDKPIQFTNAPTGLQAPDFVTHISPDYAGGSGFLIVGGSSTNIWKASSCDPATAIFTNLANSGTFACTQFVFSLTNGQMVGHIEASTPNCGVSLDNGATWTTKTIPFPSGATEFHRLIVSPDGTFCAMGGNLDIIFVSDPFSETIDSSITMGFTPNEMAFNGDGTKILFSDNGTSGALHFSTDLAVRQAIPAENNPFTLNNFAPSVAITGITWVPSIGGWIITGAGNVAGVVFESEINKCYPIFWIGNRGADNWASGIRDIDGELFLGGEDRLVANLLLSSV